MNQSMKIPERVTKLPKCIRLYRGRNWKIAREKLDFAVVLPVDTSKAACENFGNGIKVGDVFEMLPGSGYSDIDSKKLVAVGIGADKHFKMFFYVEGDEGIMHFEDEIRQVLKKMKKIGHIKLP
jgi:hypothetical protein